MKTCAATEFKIHCLALLDEVHERGETLVILKRGKPVARVLPFIEREGSPQATLLGSVSATDDLIEPPLAESEWEALDPS
mgnify:CR=1 FL=1